MTLHWWMHWFWITCHLTTCYCNTVTSPIHSLPSNIRNTTRLPIPNGTVNTNGFSRIPPNITAFINVTTVIPIKLHKPFKKHDALSNATKSVTTVNPLVKQSTVIDQNFTDASLNISDNQTFMNASVNVVNRRENLSEVVEDYSTNQSILVNSERIGVDSKEADRGSLNAAGITGITLGCVSIIGIICVVSFIVYRNYGFNRPQVLNDRCSNPDSSGYIDDSTVRENSEEMYSLDNDSFLNSLEAMTIQNLWTDTVKHTKL